jgi:hypothetical protein
VAGLSKVYTVIRSLMSRLKIASAVLTIRVPATLERQLTREARRRHRTRSEVVRDILATQLGAKEPDLAAEARRQSRLVSRRRSEREVLEFITAASDDTP